MISVFLHSVLGRMLSFEEGDANFTVLRDGINDLGDTSNAAKGAALVGFNSGLTYPAGSIGNALAGISPTVHVLAPLAGTGTVGDPITLAGALSSPVSVAALAAYNAGTTYGSGAFVAYADQSWVSLSAGNVGHTPAPGSAYWALGDTAYDWVSVATVTPGFSANNQSTRAVFTLCVQPATLDDTTIPLVDVVEVALARTATTGKGAVCARPGVTAAGTLPQTTASAQLDDRTVYRVVFNADYTLTLQVAKPTAVDRKVTVRSYLDPIFTLS